MSSRPGWLRFFGRKFVAGMLIVVPIMITVQALRWLFVFVDDLARPAAAALVGHEIPGLGAVTTLAVVWAIGLLFSAGPLKRLLDGFEDVVELIPIVGVVYATVKKVFAGFGSLGSQTSFKRFVLARLPGRTTPGFLTGSFTLKHSDGSEQRLYTVYVPSNHLWFGDVVVLPAEDVIETSLRVEDGISLLLSAGAAVPETISQHGEGSSLPGPAPSSLPRHGKPPSGA